MRLSELKGYRNEPLYDILQNSVNLQEFIENLKANGYKEYLIGEGYFSGVFARPQDNYVIKLFREDAGYSKFLDYVLKNKNNPHVPKLRGKPVKFLKHYNIVRMEKLSPTKSPQQKDIHTMLYDYVMEYNSSAVYSVINREKVENLYPQIIPILQEMTKNKMIVDFHSGNMMFRGDTPVITDPYADF